MGPIRFPETSKTNYQHTPRNFAAEQRPELWEPDISQPSGSLQSGGLFYQLSNCQRLKQNSAVQCQF
jgi:hypothetical protein